jgi:hypothetical protein
MAIVYVTYLRCDGCGRWAGVSLTDTRARTDVRPANAAGGWHRATPPELRRATPHRTRTRDLCPACWARLQGAADATAQ